MRDPGAEPTSRPCLLEHDGMRDPIYMANVSHEGEVVGEVTSAGWGHHTGKALALAMVPTELGTPNTQLSIDIFGEAVPARVLPGPVWDADFARIRA
jgi:dimethylglycine dehydrogenase